MRIFHWLLPDPGAPVCCMKQSAVHQGGRVTGQGRLRDGPRTVRKMHLRLLMETARIAQILDEMGTLLEIQGENPFRCRAYHNAAAGARAICRPTSRR